MPNVIKNRNEILQKLKISSLNEMQKEALKTIQSSDETILLSPTGTGKTLAFLLPLIEMLDSEQDGIQLLVLAPSRELAIQIEQVTREMGTGLKTNVIYGGRRIAKDFQDLQRIPSILIGTPGRILDHIDRGSFDTSKIQFVVLDEFDKALEIGFEDEMKAILRELKNRKKIVLTSATEEVTIPDFVQLNQPEKLNFLHLGSSQLEVLTVLSPMKDKLETLVETLHHLGNQPGIVFCNFKDSIQRVSAFLTKNGIDHGTFYGGMEQQDRERALIKFRNGSHRLLIATDLAARGIDIPELKFIIHYHLPLKEKEFIHRNGRTARMNKDGKAIVLKWIEEYLPEFVDDTKVLNIDLKHPLTKSNWKTLFISGGRKDKISKGDIVGLFLKKGGLNSDQLGHIELKSDCAFVGVQSKNIHDLINKVTNSKLKKKKVKISLI